MRSKKQVIGSESGRSMVEMLGVLAIMGVLAIGGVAGYRWAMDKYNANEILNEVRKRAVTASQQRILGHAINLSEYGNNGQIQGKYVVTAMDSYQGDSGFFSLTVSDIPEGICNQILQIDWAWPALIQINQVAIPLNASCIQDENEFSFIFDNTLSRHSVDLGDGSCSRICPPDAICQNLMCICPDNQRSCGSVCCPKGYTCPAAQDELGGCVPVSGCSNNQDCDDIPTCAGKTCYCDINATTEEDNPNCFSSYQGVCKKKGNYSPVAGQWLVGPDNMSYWSARNWCLSHGKRLIDISHNRLNCKDPEIGTTKKGACEGSLIVGNLNYYWGSIFWTDTTMPNSKCGVFNINMFVPAIYGMNRNILHSFYRPLCDD